MRLREQMQDLARLPGRWARQATGYACGWLATGMWRIVAGMIRFTACTSAVILLLAALFGSLSYAGHQAWIKVFLPSADKAYAINTRVVMKFAEFRGFDTSGGTPKEVLVYVPEPLPFKLDENNPCVVAIRLIAAKHQVPVQVPLMIAHTESRFNPGAVNKNKNGTTDKGCMQINTSAHPNAFARPEDAYNAVLNVDYGVQFLRRLYQETGDWRRAMVMFHSRTPAKQAVYRQSLNRSAHALDKRGMDQLIAQSQ